MKNNPSLTEIRDEVLKAFMELEESYMTSPTTTVPEKRVAYLEIQMIEHLLNAMKALEYHYRDDIPEMRTKKRWNDVMKNAHRLLKKYGEHRDATNEWSPYVLKEKFDDTGYLAHRAFMQEAKDKREELKRKR